MSRLCSECLEPLPCLCRPKEVYVIRPVPGEGYGPEVVGANAETEAEVDR